MSNLRSIDAGWEKDELLISSSPFTGSFAGLLNHNEIHLASPVLNSKFDVWLEVGSWLVKNLPVKSGHLKLIAHDFMHYMWFVDGELSRNKKPAHIISKDDGNAHWSHAYFYQCRWHEHQENPKVIEKVKKRYKFYENGSFQMYERESEVIADFFVKFPSYLMP